MNCASCGKVRPPGQIEGDEEEKIVCAVEFNPVEPEPEYHCGAIQPLGTKTKYKRVDYKKRAAGIPIGNLPEGLTRENAPKFRRPEEVDTRRLTDERIEQLDIGDDITPEERDFLIEELKKRDKVFAFEDHERGIMNPDVCPPVRIFTVPHQPWNDRAPRLTENEEIELVDFLRMKLAAGVCEKSRSPYASRWFMVRKTTGKLRWIQDLQKVNSVTIRNANRGPSPDEVTEKLAGLELYTCPDLFSGYDQILLDEKDRPITAMHTPIGLIQMRVLPQGFANAVGEFQRCMCDILDGLVPEKCIPYIDDLSIKETNNDYTEIDGIRTFVRRHIETLCEVLDRLEHAGLTISGQKTKFLHRSLCILGYRLDKEGRHLDEDKVAALRSWERPKDLSRLRSFLSFCSVYRIFIEKFAHIAAPLYELTRKDVSFYWGPRQEAAFQQLRRTMMENPPLVKPDFSAITGRPLIVTTDASPDGIGGCLAQVQPDGKRRPIRWESKSFNSTESNYGQPKRELLAILFLLKKWKHYIATGRFILEIDPIPVAYLLGKLEQPDATMLRWISIIKTFDFDVSRIPGRDNKIADGLSRSVSSSNKEQFADDFIREYDVRTATDFILLELGVEIDC